MKTDIKECIKTYVTAIQEGNAAIFAGAGLSKASGFVNWKDLMRDIALDLGLDVDNETDLIAIAQYHINDRLGNRSVINQTIIDHFTKRVTITDNHKILASLPISTYWTTNYDNLIENSLSDAGKTADVKRISENIFVTQQKRNAIVYKMHGDITMPNDAVLTKDDYEKYEITRKAYSIVLQADLLSKTFLFLGFSFDDPNLIYLLSRINTFSNPKHIRTHYAIFKKETDKDKAHKQKLRLNDLIRYGIKAVVVDNYSEITEILLHIKELNNRSNIFMSGAAEVFDDFHKENISKKFIHNLSRSLVSNNLKLITGFGYNVGSGIINGALEHVFSTKYQRIDEYIKLRPFPQYYTNSNISLTEKEKLKLKKERNAKYRNLMLSEAGISIYMFGNKKSKKGDIINSNGMYEEFKIASEMSIKPIPIGATGYMAKIIWQEVMDNYSEYYGNDVEIKKWLEIIGDKNQTPSKIYNSILNIINKLKTTFPII